MNHRHINLRTGLRAWPLAGLATLLVACGGSGDDDDALTTQSALRAQGNRLGGNLQCNKQLPAPTGSGNRAASFEDQCRAMQPTPDTAPATPVNPPVAPVPPEPGASLPLAAYATGSDVTCRNVSLGSATYGNVTVPAGARCELRATVLTGNLWVDRDASVDLSQTRIEGNLQAEDAASVQAEGGRIAGSVQALRGQTLTLAGVRVGGSVQLEAGSGLQWLQALQVTGDIQLFDQRGGASLYDNMAGGNLQCQGNLPAPTGSGNRAASMEDQCRGL